MKAGPIFQASPADPSAFVFPHVILTTRKGRKGVIARYMEGAKPRRIEFFHDYFELSPADRYYLVLHEIGHWFRFEHVSHGRQAQPSEEDFANDFAAYLISPRPLRSNKPKAYKLLETMIAGSCRDEILSFARQVTDKLIKMQNGSSV